MQLTSGGGAWLNQLTNRGECMVSAVSQNRAAYSMVQALGDVPKRPRCKGGDARTLWLEPHVMYCDSSGWYRTPLNTLGSNSASTRTPRVKSHTMHDPSADPDIHCSFPLDTFWEAEGGQRHVRGMVYIREEQRGGGGCTRYHA